MIAVVDIETHGLDARKFITACLIKENGVKKHFYNKEDLWEYIIQLGVNEARRGKKLNLYAHNHEYDFYGYADLNDAHIKFFSFRPFIASYEVNGKEIIKFLDSLAIFKMSLKKLGNMIGLEKLDMPEEFLNMERITKQRIMKLQPYVERDVEIVLDAIKLLKQKMKNEDVKVRYLYTISQIAINYFINSLKKNSNWDDLFYYKQMGMLYRTRYPEEIHGAYRGGRVECFQLGEFKNVDYIDINNLYGYASMNIKFPNLKTESMIKKPLSFFKLDSLLDNIGVSRVLIYNRDNTIGLLPIRTNTGNYYPKEDTYLLGTYTHIELEEAIKNGYEILDIEWSIIWEEMENPFKEITTRLYELRKGANDPFDNFFYKEMQNRSYGKLAQRKVGQEIVIDNVENAKQYLKENYEIINSEGFNYYYRKDKEEGFKKYYAPIIPALINAYARVKMFREFKKIPQENLLYTDTDSCILKKGYLNEFKIGNDIGEFKLEHSGKDVFIVGRKTYAIGDEIKVAGFRKSDITYDQFKKGEIKSLKMNTLKTTKDMSLVGSFSEETRDLKKQLDESIEVEGVFSEERVFKDKDINNITYFKKYIDGIIKSL